MKLKTMFMLATCLTFGAAQAQSTSPGNYCDASFDDAQGFWVEDYIAKVSFGTLNNETNAQFAAPHYVHYDNITAEKFKKGTTYDLNVSFMVRGGCGYGVWIDYNQNNIFEPEEKIAGTTGNDMLAIGTDTKISAMVTIPQDALAGKTRMRVRIVEDDEFNMTSTDILPCNESASAKDVMDWGETEDYDIEIIDESPSSIVPGVTDNKISIYPNPSNNSFKLQSMQPIDKVSIIDLMGKIVYHQNYPGITELHINTQLPTGMYHINIQSSNAHTYHKLHIMTP